MGRSVEYRRFAVRCLEIARTTGDEQTKAIMVQMAQVWSRLADEADAAPESFRGDGPGDHAG
jgi:hypothetical protein